MPNLPHILLAQDDNGLSRFIGILIVIGIFILGNVLQWIQKYQEQKRKQMQQRRAQMPPAPPAPSAPNPIRQQMPGRPTPRTQRPQQRQTVQQRRPTPAPPLPTQNQRKPQSPARVPPLPQQPQRTPAPARGTEMPAAKLTGGQDISATEIGSAGARKEAPDKRREFLRAVLNRHSLRQAYILTEILQPPVALRDSARAEQ